MISPGRRLVVVGTDTCIGKTIVSAGLVDYLQAAYWKPIQSGLEEATDSEIVLQLSGVSAERIFPERWKLKAPLSPHHAAELEDIWIDPSQISFPLTERLLLIEGTGGIMVPINRQTLWIDVLADWSFPLIICARTQLGTINHSLLTIKALQARAIPILGIIFVGEAHPESERIICDLGQVRRLGRLNKLYPLNPQTLQQAFQTQFNRADFM